MMASSGRRRRRRWRRYGTLAAFLLVNAALLLLLFALFNTTPLSAGRRAAGPAAAAASSSVSGRRLLDLDGFEYVVDSGACESAANRTPIVVHSYVGHFAARLALRRSYPRTVLDALGLGYVFMVGLSNSSSVQSRLVRESRRHGDIVQGNFADAYRNLTYKHVMGLTWFAERCRGSAHVVKMDDDIAVNVFKLSAAVRRAADHRDLAGCVIRAKPIRDKRNKWYVSEREFAGTAYPPFLSGWLYVAKTTAVARLLAAIPSENYFWIDDLYVTGVLARRAGLNLTDLRPDFETDPGPIHCCIHKRQRCEFLAAPTGDDYRLLEQYARQLTHCKTTNASCDAFRKSKRHHSCLDLWKKPVVQTRKGKPSIEILN